MLYEIPNNACSRRKSPRHWSLMIVPFFVLFSLLFSPFHESEAKNVKLSVADIILLKQVGYTESQIVQEIDKLGLKGKFHLTTKEILKLRQAGFSSKLIRYMGIKKPPRSTQAPVSLAELKSWLKSQKETNWIHQQLTRRGIRKQEFGPLAIISLNRMGMPLKLLKLIYRLKRKSSSSPPPPRKNLPLEDIPFLPGLNMKLPKFSSKPPKRPRKHPSVYPSLNRRKKSRWGQLRKNRALSLRERRLRERQAFWVPRPRNGLYQHIGHQFTIYVPKGWNIYEDANPDNGHLVLYLSPEEERRIEYLTKGVTISLRYISPNSTYRKDFSLLQNSRRFLQEYLSSQNAMKEWKKLSKTQFFGHKATTVTLLGKERLGQRRLKRQFFFVKKGYVFYQLGYFSKPDEFEQFEIQAKALLKKFHFADEVRRRRGKRLEEPYKIQRLIQKNIRGVVSISVALKKKDGTTIYAASGSGFVVTPDGYVITNHHVAINSRTGRPYKSYVLNWDSSTKLKSVRARFVAAAFQYPERRKIQLVDKRTGRISVRYQRQHVDIALLKIIPQGRYPTVPLSSIDNAMLGDTVVTMGFPLEGSGVNTLGNEDITATTGRISRLVRMGLHRKVNEIQHTAKIAGGNSGGPLFDAYTGSVIGINTWVGIFDKRLARPAMGVGYYYALPIDLAWQFFPDYLDYSSKNLRHLQWFELGSQWMASNQFDPARRAFLRVLSLRPQFLPAYASLSRLYFDKALQFNNDKRVHYMNLARRWADKGLKRDLENPVLMQLLAKIALTRQDWNTTAYLLKKLLKRYPSDWKVHTLQAIMLMERGKIKQALAEADIVMNFTGDLLPTGYLLKGTILYRAKRYFEGQQAYRMALQIAPNNLDAHIGEALGYLHLKQYEDAIDYLKKLEKRYRYEPSLYRTQMRVYALSKAYKKAWLAFRSYWRTCNLKAKTPDAASLFIAGLLAKKILSPRYRTQLAWGLWGALLYNHTHTSYAARASILLANEARQNRFYGLMYGILKLGYSHFKNPLLKKRLERIRRRLKPMGLSRQALAFLFFKTAPRWKPELIWKLFTITPSLLDRQTAVYFAKRGVPVKLILMMYRLSVLRRRRGMRPSQRHYRPRHRRRYRHSRKTRIRPARPGSLRDIQQIRLGVQYLFKALYQGDLDLWMSVYAPIPSQRAKYRKIFFVLYKGLSAGWITFYPLKREKIKWLWHPRYGKIAHYYFRAKMGRKPVKNYYWSFRKYGPRWVTY